MKMVSFNLLTEPWIPVVTGDGTKRELGIEDVLARAHNINGIVDSSPLLQFGMYRLLVAFIMNVFRYECIDDIADAIARGRFDMDKISAYCQKWHDRFDLFDEKHPFYQVPVNDDEDDKKKSPAELFKQMPVGSNPMHFSMTRVHDREHAVSPAACARGLCALPPFAMSGGSGFAPGINKTPPIYALIAGNTLFETVVLNVPAIGIEGNDGTGVVAWESDEITAKKDVDVVSTLQGMTFQPRSVHLFPGEGGKCTITGKESSILVREIIFGHGLKFTGEWTDPSVAYITSDERKCIKMIEGKSIWRDTGPLMICTHSTHGSEKKGTKIVYERPFIVHQWDVLIREKSLSWRSLVISVYGLLSDKAKIFEWEMETLSMPVEVMNDPDTASHVISAMDVANDVDYAIKTSLTNLFQNPLKKEEKNKKKLEKTTKNLIVNALNDFWSMMEPVFRDDFIWSIARRDKNDVNAWTAVDEAWKKIAVKTGAIVVDAIIESAGTVARFILNGVVVRETYNNIMYSKFNKKNVKKQ
jgi:CRISPR system Cascade subunit CasA